MVLLGVNSARGRPLGEYIFEKMAKISWTVEKFSKNSRKIPLYLQDYSSERNEPRFSVKPMNCRVYNQFNASRSGLPEKRYGLSKKIFQKKSHFFAENFNFDPLFEFSGQNASRN